MTTMHLDIVSAEEEIFSGNVKNIIAAATMGEVGIYPKHTPMITPLKPGEIKIITEEDTEQLFFISYANNFRGKIREEAQKNYLRIDPHSPGYFRVNQSVRNMDEFHEAFNTTSKDSMFLIKNKRVYIW